MLGLILCSIFGIIYTILLGIAYYKIGEHFHKKRLCPNCGRRLMHQKSNGITFIKCSSYPKCKYMKIRKTRKL